MIIEISNEIVSERAIAKRINQNLTGRKKNCCVIQKDIESGKP